MRGAVSFWSRKIMREIRRDMPNDANFSEVNELT